MNHSYQELLNTKIESKISDLTGKIIDRNGETFLVTQGKELPFPILYKEENHDYILIAAQQLLDIYVERNMIQTKTKRLAEQVKKDMYIDKGL